jgi:hypothetical protein
VELEATGQRSGRTYTVEWCPENSNRYKVTLIDGAAETVEYFDSWGTALLRAINWPVSGKPEAA